jgi:hypothetical protein
MMQDRGRDDNQTLEQRDATSRSKLSMPMIKSNSGFIDPTTIQELQNNFIQQSQQNQDAFFSYLRRHNLQMNNHANSSYYDQRLKQQQSDSASSSHVTGKYPSSLPPQLPIYSQTHPQNSINFHHSTYREDASLFVSNSNHGSSLTTTNFCNGSGGGNFHSRSSSINPNLSHRGITLPYSNNEGIYDANTNLIHGSLQMSKYSDSNSNNSNIRNDDNNNEIINNNSSLLLAQTTANSCNLETNTHNPKEKRPKSILRKKSKYLISTPVLCKSISDFNGNSSTNFTFKSPTSILNKRASDVDLRAYEGVDGHTKSSYRNKRTKQEKNQEQEQEIRKYEQDQEDKVEEQLEIHKSINDKNDNGNVLSVYCNNELKDFEDSEQNETTNTTTNNIKYSEANDIKNEMSDRMTNNMNNKTSKQVAWGVVYYYRYNGDGRNSDSFFNRNELKAFRDLAGILHKLGDVKNPNHHLILKDAEVDTFLLSISKGSASTPTTTTTSTPTGTDTTGFNANSACAIEKYLHVVQDGKVYFCVELADSSKNIAHNGVESQESNATFPELHESITTEEQYIDIHHNEMEEEDHDNGYMMDDECSTNSSILSLEGIEEMENGIEFEENSLYETETKESEDVKISPHRQEDRVERGKGELQLMESLNSLLRENCQEKKCNNIIVLESKRRQNLDFEKEDHQDRSATIFTPSSSPETQIMKPKFSSSEETIVPEYSNEVQMQLASVPSPPSCDLSSSMKPSMKTFTNTTSTNQMQIKAKSPPSSSFSRQKQNKNLILRVSQLSSSLNINPSFPIPVTLMKAKADKSPKNNEKATRLTHQDSFQIQRKRNGKQILVN